ncbi:glycan-binding surface protein [Pontibacter silvestris]|uniref:Glycan-binding surface protein n=1 Tax=Pontibacter silvestris TaxID=2305183 RepID=A0ABW4WZ20_9BACT|nr:glycan-binding surface protein [Pontibacter silvestris]MCC9137595.1 glycan-binding surface protein [Pontibacter silvestris]
MKLNYKSLLFLFIAFAMVGVFSSCTDDDDNAPNGGKPMISYIRITRPEASDSLIAKAGQGAMIAIIGQNLQDARELWVNDQQAALIPTFITNTSIITRVPNRIPEEITNKMKIVFANGDSLIHDFTVDISDPVISYMESEHVNTGEVATIVGSFFYEQLAPLTVTFTGDVTGEVVSVEDDRIEVRVPEGAEPGPITVTTSFGETESDFWFRDNRNIIAGFEETDFSGWWHGKDYIVSSDPDIQAINNNFLRINKPQWGASWLEFWVGNGGTLVEATKAIPAQAFENPSNYVLKFEINTLASLSGAEVRMYMGPDMGGEREKIYYTWKPNIDTGGDWETVSIPFEDFLEANTSLEYNPEGYQASFFFANPQTMDINFALDNMRVVPLTAE